MDRGEEIIEVPSGFRFKPQPEELLNDYLRPRLLNQRLPCPIIKDMNVYGAHPRDLLGDTPADEHRYFFSRRQKRHPNGTRPIRTINEGYWKASTGDKIIRNKYKKEIGCKKTLVFYEGHRPNGVKTNWLMHEYVIKKFWFPTTLNEDKLGDLALYEIYKKPNPRQAINDDGGHQAEGEGLAAKSLSNGEDMENEKGNNYDSHQIQSLHPHCQSVYDPHSFDFNNADNLRQPVDLSYNNDSSCLASIPSWISTSLPFQNQLLPLPQYSPPSEFGITIDPCSSDQIQLECMPTLQPDFFADHLMSSTFQSSAPTTLWPPSKISFHNENMSYMPPVQLGITDDSTCSALLPPSLSEHVITIEQPSQNQVQPEYMPTLQSDFSAFQSFAPII